MLQSNFAKFGIVIVVWGAILSIMILMKFIVLIGGTTIYLKVEPVDPRDLFRGDYVILGYGDMSRLSSPQGDRFESNQPIGLI